jgi:hypothetical protein
MEPSYYGPAAVQLLEDQPVIDENKGMDKLKRFVPLQDHNAQHN